MTSVVFAQTAFAVNTIAVDSSNFFIIFSLFIALHFLLSTSPTLHFHIEHHNITYVNSLKASNLVLKHKHIMPRGIAFSATPEGMITIMWILSNQNNLKRIRLSSNS